MKDESVQAAAGGTAVHAAGAAPADVPSAVVGRSFLPTGWTLAALIVALCFLAGVVGWRVGQGSPPARDSADVGFLYDMIHHHNQAVTMARIELFDGQVLDVKTFADEVARLQSLEVGLMMQKLNEFGFAVEDVPDGAMGWMGHTVARDEMPGLASDDELELLRSGENVDAVFLALMADHHAGAVDMAERATRQADDEDVRLLAERMAKSQRFEIRELLAAADRANLDRTPGGVTVDQYDPATGAIRSPKAEHAG